jgi:protein TonB
MERMGRQGAMKFGSNITFSAIVHAMVIMAATALAGWNAASRAPGKYVMVTLIRHEAPVQQELGGKRDAAGESSHHLRKKLLRKPDVAPSPLPEQKETTPGPKPLRESQARDEGGPIKAGQTEVRVPIQEDYEGGSREAFSGSVYEVVPVKEGTGDNPEAGKDRTKAGYDRVLGAIRAAIEKSKSYPPLAKRRKQEGTVFAEFSISARGVAENVRVTRSSGFSLLDSAARETIVRAAPFPVVDGRIEVQISFVLE